MSREELREAGGIRYASREAACLAHDQNNLLQVAFEKLRVLKLAGEWDSVLLRRLDGLEQVLERMELLNRAALTGFRASAVIDSVDPDEVIVRTVDLAKSLRAGPLPIEVELGVGRTRVPILSIHLQQVLLNLLKNAAEAGPTVPSSPANVHLRARYSPSPPGRCRMPIDALPAIT